MMIDDVNDDDDDGNINYSIAQNKRIFLLVKVVATWVRIFLPLKREPLFL